MASVSTSKANGTRRILFVDPGTGNRRTVFLGTVTMKVANEIRMRIEYLISAKAGAVAIDSDTQTWLTKIDDSLHAKLVAVGLVPERGKPAQTTLGAFVRSYIESRTDVKPSTTKNLVCAERRMLEFFGADRPIGDITAGETDEWAIKLKKQFAEATAARTIKRARQFFTFARRKKLITENPFETTKIGRMENPERIHFVSMDAYHRLIEAAPDAEWRAIIALARIGGLRTPSEVLALTWSDVAWDKSRVLIRSAKLEHTATRGRRWIPLFPELRPHLEALFDVAVPGGSPYVITRYRDSNQNLRTTFEKIIYRAPGLLPWPRLFQNLRASRATELAEKFPAHVVAAWMGHSVAVSAKHYLSVRESDFDEAARSYAKYDAPTTQKCDAGTSGLTDSKRQEKTSLPETLEAAGVVSPYGLKSDLVYTITGAPLRTRTIEDSPGESAFSENSYAFCNAESELASVIQAWPDLSPHAKAMILSIVRSAAGAGVPNTITGM